MELSENIKNFSVFSEKMRFVLRNIIYMFHRERTACLYLLKQDMPVKVVADKEDDFFACEKDPEALALKQFDEWVAENRQSIIIADINKEVRFVSDKTETVRSLISVPVMINDGVAGILKITSEEPGVFSREDLRFLDIVSGIIGKVLAEEAYV